MLFKPLADVVAIYKLKLVNSVLVDSVPLTLEPYLSVRDQANNFDKNHEMPAKSRTPHVFAVAIVTVIHLNRKIETVARIVRLVALEYCQLS